MLPCQNPFAVYRCSKLHIDAVLQAIAAGQSKAALSISKTFFMGILGGAFIGFGSFLALSVGGACPGLASTNPGLQKMVYGAFGLPFGLLLVLMCGAELFTGNTALVTASVSLETIHLCYSLFTILGGAQRATVCHILLFAFDFVFLTRFLRARRH